MSVCGWSFWGVPWPRSSHNATHDAQKQAGGVTRESVCFPRRSESTLYQLCREHVTAISGHGSLCKTNSFPSALLCDVLGQSEVFSRYTVDVCVLWLYCMIIIWNQNCNTWHLSWLKRRERAKWFVTIKTNPSATKSFNVRGRSWNLSPPALHPYRGSPGSAVSGSLPGSLTLCRCHQCPVLQHTEMGISKTPSHRMWEKKKNIYIYLQTFRQ